MRVVTKRLRLLSRCFHFNVALHLSYLLVKFDDEIDRGSLDLELNSRVAIYSFAEPFVPF